MLTVAPCAVLAQHQHASVVAERLTAATPSSSLFSAIAIIVVLMLLSFALDWLGTLLAGLWAMTRLLFSAAGVALLLILAVVVLIGGLVAATMGW
jgi:hypothetical protein